MTPWIQNVPEEEAATRDPEPDTVLISIQEPFRVAPLTLPLGYVDVLHLRFHDYDGERFHPADAVLFDVEMAQAVVRFAEAYRGKNIRVHCAAGVSRSGAVAETLLMAFPEYEDKGWRRFPNGHVRRLLRRAFGLVPIGAEVDS